MNEPIAIVGIGCRFGTTRGPAEFWEWVRSGRNAVREAPQHRIDLGYDVDHFFDPRLRIPGRISSKKAGFLEHPELFDPAAFGIAPRDAMSMEPQQRLMAEVSWDALEDAGIVPESLVGERVAVILGFMAEDYSRERMGVLGEDAAFRGHDVFSVAGISHAVLSGRVSFLLGLKGPSLTLDTACSSSLIATHLACQSLRCGESKLAIAGGVNLFLTPEGNIALSRSGMLSMSGACKAFDASADGFVRAEGAGVVVLRPLADAQQDGNPIYAVIRGSGVSTDGRDGGHMMAPSREGQVQAMRDAYRQAHLSPAEIDYVEAHGTGTVIGDPIEIAALAEVMGPGRDPERPLRVASVKGNLGHTESASGVAGLIKSALAIRHRELPAQLHFEKPHPAIPWDEIPIRVQAETTPWPHDGTARIGVNSFGISGTNAHVILESPPAPPSRAAPDAAPERPLLLPLTGHDANALHENVVRHREALDAPDAPGLRDLGYTLGRRRTHRAHRLGVVASSMGELRRELDAYLSGEPTASVRGGVAPASGPPRLAMVFPGQGAQWLGMGRELLAGERGFRDSIDRLDAAYRAHVDWSLREVLEGGSAIDWRRRLDVLQPLLIAFEIALAELWQGFGVRADLVIGQSLGEIAAARVAGVLDLADVARLACERGRIVAQVSGRGAMAVVFAPREAVEEAIAFDAGRIEVAGSNSPTTTILSGDADAVRAAVDAFEARGTFARRLEVDFASHCFHMDPLLDAFRARIEDVAPRPGSIPFVSTVDGETKEGAQLDVAYWIRNLRAPVAFDRGLARALDDGAQVFLEISPHPTLSRAVDETARAAGHTAVHVGSVQRGADERRSLACALGELFARGVEVDFARLHPQGRVAALPLYAFQRKRFWFGERTRADRFRPVHPLLGERSWSSVDPRLHTWDFLVDADTASFLGELRLDGRAVAPDAIHAELALAAAEALWPGAPVTVAGLDVLRPLWLGESGRRRVQLTLRVEGERRGALRVSVRTEDASAWELLATCTLSPGGDTAVRELTTPAADAAADSIDPDAFSAVLERSGIALGPRCRTLRELRREPATGALVARLRLPRTVEHEWHAYRAHPALLESSLQLVGALLEEHAGVRISSVGEIRFTGELGSDCQCRVERRTDATAPQHEDAVEADLAFFTADGAPLGRVSGVRAQALRSRAATESASGLHHVEWQRVDAPAHDTCEVSHWLVLTDALDEASSLAVELDKRGLRFALCGTVEELEGAADAMPADTPWGVLLLAWAGADDASAAERFDVRAIRGLCEGAAQVWLATRGVQPVRDGEAGAAATRLAHLASDLEPESCRLFDASRALDHAERMRLAELIGSPGEERLFAARGEDLFVPRLVAMNEAAASEPQAQAAVRAPAADRSFRAVHGRLEILESVALEEAPTPELGAEDVEVEVRAAALSQLDVLAGLGLARAGTRVPQEGMGVGLDFAGVVTAVGSAAHGFAVGDEVVGLREGSLARRLVVRPDSLGRKPASLGFAEAAGLPLAYLTAKVALQQVARLQPGERVLIPSAAGGVGLALVGVARSMGAEVFATTSSAPGRDALRDRGAHVIELARDAASAGTEPFDVIVSGASGPAMHAALALLAPGGRYIDLCPRGRYERPELGVLELGANRSLAAVDVLDLLERAPAQVSALLGEAMDEIDRAELPPLPTTTFPVAESGRALRFLAQNRHVGRVCVDFRSAAQTPIRARHRGAVGLAERSIVVSGDDTARRSAIAEWLREQGATEVRELGSEEVRAAASHAAEPWGGWIHLGADTRPGPDPVEPLLAASQAEWRALVWVREPVAGDTRRDRRWESRVHLGPSSTPGSPGPVRLSVGADHTGAQIGRLLSSAWRPDRLASPLFAMSASELAQRVRTAPSPLLQHLAPGGETSTVRLEELIAATPPERRSQVQHLLLHELAGVLALSEEHRSQLDPRSRLADLGLDSLMTLELFVGIATELQLEIAPDWFSPDPTIAEIASVLADRLGGGLRIAAA